MASGRSPSDDSSQLVQDLPVLDLNGRCVVEALHATPKPAQDLGRRMVPGDRTHNCAKHPIPDQQAKGNRLPRRQTNLFWDSLRFGWIALVTC